MRKPSIKKLVTEEMIRIKEEASAYDVGSEDYLSAMKAWAQLSEINQKLNKIDINVLIPGLCSVVSLIFLAWYQKHNILDTRVVQFVRGLWRR